MRVLGRSQRDLQITNNREKGTMKKKHNPNETNTTKSPVEPELSKPRPDEDDDGQDIVAKSIASD